MKSHHLPLVGLVVSSIGLSLDKLPSFGFGGYPMSILELEKANILLVRGNVSHRLSRLSATTPEGDLKPFAEVFGSLVHEAIGHGDGVLRIKFEDGWELTVEPVLMASRYYTWNWFDFAWRVVIGDTAWYGELGRVAIEKREN
jgi:hypothetical protein